MEYLLRAGFLLCLFLLFSAAVQASNNNIQQAPGGIVISGGAGLYQTSFGNVNALGIGPASQTGVTILQLSNGALYYSPYDLGVTGPFPGNDTAYVTAYINPLSNFTHPAALQVWSCPSTSGCTSSGNFSPMSLNPLSPTPVIPKPGMRKNVPTAAGLAIFVPDNNGASAFSGGDTATITFNFYRNSNDSLIGTATLSLNLPAENVQSAVQLQLSTAPSGLTVSASSDYLMNFSNVNGLGIGPAPGLTAIAQAGGFTYSTPYLVSASFSDQTSTTSAITVCTQTPFTHSTILKLQDASASAGPFTAIPNCGSTIQIAAAAADRSSLTRYLGLFVSNTNGPGSFTGSDSAVLTYTITVP